ncbi:G2/mitotic-specific cyclin-B [Collichthys lucidus]|uniref:G2/mitotic-specific cyclin-B n=1 Tax=Collichthys lucidus TaxID=240159 RepID=A0A4U5V0Y1_COLLU|nr:G2/mitotic-specific cyclin-B [Collichthys lucidus]
MTMARTGFCDSKPLLDLHKKADERRAPLRTWANTCGPIDRWQPVEVEESRMAPVKMETEHRWGLHSLQALVPSLLRHEVETALERLDLIWDRTYAWDMFLDMMRTQSHNSLPNADLPQHFTDVTHAILVDWLIQVHEMMHFQAETLYLAVHLLYRSLRQLKVATANLQLLGMVCLFLAAKKEECLLPEVSGLCYLMDHTYTKHQLLRMERKVLCGLKFDLSYCPPLHFLVLLASIARCSTKAVWMARYLLELSLLEAQCVVFLPVQLAGAALCLSRQVLQEPPTPEGEAAWCLASSLHVGSETALLRIMHILASAAAKAHTRETCATFIKFSSPETMHVSRHPGLKNAPRSSMPKEQPCLSEHSLCTASSKNAKDKSNSTTLLAIRNTKDADHSSGQGSRCSSEKDSGYSDGSDWQQTDVEDQRSNKSQSQGSEHAQTSQPGQNQEPKRENPGNSSAGRDLSPIYIINNMVLKQPDMIQKRVQLPQRNGSMETSSSGPAHMILLQQPSLLPTTHQLHKPLSRKPNTAGKKINGTYLPILNSYPRIAPHPSKKPPDKSSLNDESQNLSKRVCTEHKREDTSVTPSLPEQHINKQPKLAALTSGLPCSSLTRDGLASSSPTTVSLSQGTQSGSSLCTTTTSSFLSTRGLLRNGGTNIRHRRFFNTVQILKQSGLLDITLRTKELLRQSNATERDVAQLRQHTELLCQVASNPSGSLNGITAWEHLHRSMAESGSYPDLKILQNLQIPCHPDFPNKPENISTADTNSPLAAENSPQPRSRLLTTTPNPNQTCPVPQQSHSGQGRELEASCKSSEKITFTPPDSSTD